MFFACLALRYFLWPFRHLHNSPVFHQPFTLGGLFGTCVHFLVFSPHSSLRDPHSVQCRIDRKSTRLNSSHGYISYAVFCLKKKKKKQDVIILFMILNTIVYSVSVDICSDCHES